MFKSRALNGAFMFLLLTGLWELRIQQADSVWNNFWYFISLCATIGFVLLWLLEKIVELAEKETNNETK